MLRSHATRQASALAGCFLACGTNAGLLAQTPFDPVPRRPAPFLSSGYAGDVRGVGEYGGKIYVSGDFSTAGLGCGSALAIDPLTGARHRFPDVNGPTIVISDGADGWFLAGTFTSVGGLPRAGFAHVLSGGSVDPSWTIDPLLNGMPVTTMCLHQGRLFLGGLFQVPGSNARAAVAVDAATGAMLPWAPFGQFSPYFMPHVQAIVGYGNDVICVGSNLGMLANPGTPSMARRVDAVTGVETPGISSSSLSSGYCAALDGSTLYVGGNFTFFGGAGRTNLGAFDLASNTLLPWNPGANDPVHALAVGSNQVFVGGAFTVIGGAGRGKLAAFDRATGALMPLALPVVTSAPYDGVKALLADGQMVWAGGEFTTVGGQARRAFAAIDASTGMGTLVAPDLGLIANVRSLARSTTSLCLGGSFRSTNHEPRTGFAAFDAATSALDPLQIAVDAPAFLAISGSTLWLTGSFYQVNGVGPRFGFAAIDLTTETVLPHNLTHDGSWLGQALVAGDRLFLSGNFHTMNGQPRYQLAAIDLATASLLPFAPPDLEAIHYSCIAANSTRVFAAGWFSRNGAPPTDGIAAFDRETGALLAWDPALGAQLNVTAMAATERSLYVSGIFSAINGQLRQGLAEIDVQTALPTAWNPQNVGNIGGSAIAVVGSSVVVARGGSTLGRLLAVDRTTAAVTALGAGPDEPGWPITRVHAAGTHLYATGSVVPQGNQPRTALARFPILLPAAAIQSGGAGCAPGGVPVPELVARTPVFGDTLLGLTAVPGSFVLQYVSFPGTVPVQISPTCFVHLHLLTASSIGAFVVGGAGTHDLTFTLPPLPMLWGLSLRYQALVVPPTLGLALSNAVDTLVGF